MSRSARPALLLTVCALVAVACGGHAVVVDGSAQQAAPDAEASGPAVATSESEPGDAGAEELGGGGGAVSGPGGGPVSGATDGGEEGATGGRAPGTGRCATNANPAEGFTADTIKIGTILPLSGALRPLGEQLARVMKVMMEEWLPENDFIPGPLEHLNWDCPQRPGIFGRRVELQIFSLQANTPEEALAGMRRLIDVEKVFLVRDCTLTDSLMGPATQYQNSKGVPAIYCHFGGMPVPALERWNFNPGIDPLTQAAIHIGYLIEELGRQRIAILADVNDTNIIDTVRRVAAHLGRPIPDRCVVTSRSQEASAGMASQVAALRTCYPTGPDAVFAGDGLQAVFGAIEAKRQGWRGADVGVQWSCTNPTCWAEVLGEICGDACQGMLTDCASLPCVPWADPAKYPAVANLVRSHRTYLPGEPADAATYGTISIGSGISYYLTMTGPDLSREKFRQTMETKVRNWNSGIGPVLNILPTNHYGGRAQWLIRFTGRPPWFEDETGDFVTLDSFGIPSSVVYG